MKKLYLITVILVLSACASLPAVLDPPTVTLSSIDLKQLGLFEQQFLVKLRLKNPNDVMLPITGMDYQITLNDQKFAHGVSNQAVSVPANGDALADVTVTSNLQSLLNQIGPLANSGGAVNYRINGHVSVVNRALKLPFDYSGKVGLPGL